MDITSEPKRTSQQKWNLSKKRIKRHWQLYLLLILPLTWVIIFRYIPMYGLQIAFRDYRIADGFFHSPWAGLRHFRSFMGSHQFPRLVGNTVILSLYTLVAGFFPPIILAVALNECRLRFFQKSVQLITYAPYFLSTVVVVSMLMQIFALHGVVNAFISMFGGTPISFLANAGLFRHLYVWSEVWQRMGYTAIIYIAALAGINPELQEAAEIDGANIWKRIWHVDLPGIMPTVIILFILSTANILNVGFEKVFLMQNPLNMNVSDIIATFTWRMGLVDMNFSFATAVGLFQSVISFVFLLTVNKISRHISDISLW